MGTATVMSAIDILIGAGVLSIQLCVLLLFLGLFTRESKAHSFVRTNAGLLGFVISLAAALGTLYYSEIVGILPCKLCWYQRALLYPQVLLFAYSVLKKDARVFLYTSILSLAGALVALYHISLPLWQSSIFCDPASELCLIQSVHIFGYMTIPMMSGSVFAALFFLSIYGYRNRGILGSRTSSVGDALASA
jgi:disulfide bond formation protein DsbB